MANKKIADIFKFSFQNSEQIKEWLKAKSYTTPPMRAITGIKLPDDRIFLYGQWGVIYEDETIDILSDKEVQEKFTGYSSSKAKEDWVSVEDGLPEDEKEVLGVHFEAGGIEKVFYDHEEKRWVECDLTCVGQILISHWMPLPSPPSPPKDNR